MGDVKAFPGKTPCPYCEGDHIWSACKRIRRMQFFGEYEGVSDIHAIEFWPEDGFEFDIPDDDILLVESADED